MRLAHLVNSYINAVSTARVKQTVLITVMMNFTKLTVTALVVLAVVTTGRALSDAELWVPELIKSRGFDAEIHTVRTVDGYYLDIHRIKLPPNVLGADPGNYLNITV